MKLRLALALLSFSALALEPASVAAQAGKKKPAPTVVTTRPRPPQRPRKPPRARPASGAPSPGLKARSGFAVAQRSLKSDQPETRARGLERLGAVGTPAALELLAKSLEPGGDAKTFEERLTAVRALAAHARSPIARPALARIMASASTEDESVEVLVRGTAALALARSGEPAGIEVLGKALRQEGPVAQAAAMALVAHPPRDLGPIVRSRGALTLGLVEALEELGDQRAFHALRGFAKYGPAEHKARAALALTRLGDYETVAVARHWLRTEKEPALRLAAGEILTLSAEPDAPRALLALLSKPETADRALALALANPSPALVPTLAKRLETAEPSTAPALIGAIGRAGGERAATVLERELSRTERAASAAYALALFPDSRGGEVLEGALGRPATRRLAARALVIRALRLGQRASGLGEALDALLASSVAADRAAGAWGHAALDPNKAVELVAHEDLVVVRAAARTALGRRAAIAAVEQLGTTSDPLTRTALAIGLCHAAGAERAPTRLLAELVAEGGPAAPLAARALAARDASPDRPQLETLLASGDPVVRAHVALGLAESDDPSALGLLAKHYRTERDAAVRHAVVIALSQRREASRERTLRLAADLDPDSRVRQAARRARAGSRLSALPVGGGTFWLELVDSGTGTGSARGALVSTPSGVGLPVVSDPDGLITLDGLPEGPVSLRLASSADESKASKPRGFGGGR